MAKTITCFNLFVSLNQFHALHSCWGEQNHQLLSKSVGLHDGFQASWSKAVELASGWRKGAAAISTRDSGIQAPDPFGPLKLTSMTCSCLSPLYLHDSALYKP